MPYLNDAMLHAAAGRTTYHAFNNTGACLPSHCAHCVCPLCLPASSWSRHWAVDCSRRVHPLSLSLLASLPLPAAEHAQHAGGLCPYGLPAAVGDCRAMAELCREPGGPWS